MSPPANIRHPMNIGTASIIRIVASIFVMPHVILNARLIAFANKQIASIDKIISIIFIALFFIYFFVLIPLILAKPGFFEISSGSLIAKFST